MESGFSVERAARDIEDRLREQGTPERAVAEKAYLKSDLEFFGTSMPKMRATLKAFRAGAADLRHDDVVALAEALWERPIHECRSAAVQLLDFYGGTLEVSDVPLIERMLRESKTWALVDDLSASVMGPLVERRPELGTTLDCWADDDDFWLRRSALLSLLIPLRRGGGDFERFGRYADGMLAEREFFIRKAIGWVLRDTSRKRPELVASWLRPRASRASGLTVREAVKHLSPDVREELLASYRAGDGQRPRGRRRPAVLDGGVGGGS